MEPISAGDASFNQHVNPKSIKNLKKQKKNKIELNNQQITDIINDENLSNFGGSCKYQTNDGQLQQRRIVKKKSY